MRRKRTGAELLEQFDRLRPGENFSARFFVIFGHERRGFFAGECFAICLKVFAARANFPMVNKFEHGDLLAPRRQERQVWKFNFFAAFLKLNPLKDEGRELF